jgi:hypothetical protein
MTDFGAQPSGGASSVREATAIAAIHAYRVSRHIPQSAIRVYRVSLVRFHVAPLSILEEIERRMTEGVAVGVLVREYWAPTGTWYLERAQLL